MKSVASIVYIPYAKELEQQDWDRYIVVDTENPLFQFDYIHDECVIVTSQHLCESEE